MTPTKQWVLLAIGCGSFVAALLVADHFFAVPDRCGCRATAPTTLSDAFILDNSIGDARDVTIVANPARASLEICYSEKPKHGEVNRQSAGLTRCEWDMNYELDESQESKTDIGTVITYSVFGRAMGQDNRSDKSEAGTLYLNRSTNSCSFFMHGWIQDLKKEHYTKSLHGKI
jgi:hypothetical protein